MKIIFFGTSDFAVPSLKMLDAIPSIEISAVITQPDKAFGRKKIITPTPVKKTAVELNLEVFQPKNINELNSFLKNKKADFFVVISYGVILPKEILKIPKYCSINVHASLLPRYRGASPIQHSLLNGDGETGVSIIKMTEKMDEGPVYLIRKVKITDEDNYLTLFKKLSELSGKILPLVLEDIKENNLVPFPQDEKKASYCKKIKKEDGKINWNKSAEEIRNMIRAYNPWPSAYTDFNSKNIKIFKAKTEEKNSSKKPGTFFLENKTLKISTKKGNLLPVLLQPEGKKVMDAESFINGYKQFLPITKTEPAPDKEI